MIKRIVEVSSLARLSVKNNQMVIEREGFERETVPVEDLGVLILDNPEITHTQGLLSACFENNVAVVVCDAKHLPKALLMPLDGHNLHSRIIARQVQVTEPVRKRLWQAIVQAKIIAQAKALQEITGERGLLETYAGRVRRGDPENIEAQAARIYWQRLFGPPFRRDRDAPGINALLNYGYAVMRAAVARAVVGAGLHPSLGLHHRNQYNSLCLADDLLEPLRPAVDRKVHEISCSSGGESELTPAIKKALLEILGYNFVIGGQNLPLIPALHRYAASIRGVILGEGKRVEFPEL